MRANVSLYKICIRWSFYFYMATIASKFNTICTVFSFFLLLLIRRWMFVSFYSSFFVLFGFSQVLTLSRSVSLVFTLNTSFLFMKLWANVSIPLNTFLPLLKLQSFSFFLAESIHNVRTRTRTYFLFIYYHLNTVVSICQFTSIVYLH